MSFLKNGLKSMYLRKIQYVTLTPFPIHLLIKIIIIVIYVIAKWC